MNKRSYPFLLICLLLVSLPSTLSQSFTFSLLPVSSPTGAKDGAAAFSNETFLTIGGFLQTGRFQRFIYLWNATVSKSTNGKEGWFRIAANETNSPIPQSQIIIPSPAGGFGYNSIIPTSRGFWNFDLANIEIPVQLIEIKPNKTAVMTLKRPGAITFDQPTSARNGQMTGLLPDQKSVIVAGGCACDPSGKRIDGGAFGDAFIFDTETERWRRITALPVTLFDAASGVVGNEFIVIGGKSSRGLPATDSISTLVFSYNIATNAWRNATDEYSGYTGALQRQEVIAAFGRYGFTSQNNILRLGSCTSPVPGFTGVQYDVDVFGGGSWKKLDVKNLDKSINLCGQTIAQDPKTGIVYSFSDATASASFRAFNPATQSFFDPYKPIPDNILTNSPSPSINPTSTSPPTNLMSQMQNPTFLPLVLGGVGAAFAVVGIIAAVLFIKSRQRIRRKGSIDHSNIDSTRISMDSRAEIGVLPETFNAKNAPPLPDASPRRTIRVGTRDVPILSAPPTRQQRKNSRSSSQYSKSSANLQSRNVTPLPVSIPPEQAPPTTVVPIKSSTSSPVDGHCNEPFHRGVRLKG
ncbi:hypothetical protein HK098_001682 [Nowakowskiella sp. JEL0407]|nr:hypothetical protein HK098_001682 [Nowakowskiella sp. JEL0407]